MHIRNRIERYLRASGTPPTRFGRQVARDPRLVDDLRNGREMGAALHHKVSAYLAEQGA
jgi:hypothetical protein